jgi:hypothetical protein
MVRSERTNHNPHPGRSSGRIRRAPSGLGVLADVLRGKPARIPAWQARGPLYGTLDNAHHLRRRPLAVSLIRQTSPKQYSRLAPRFAAPVASPAPIAGPGCECSTSLLRLRAQLRHAHQPRTSLSIQRRTDSCRLPPAEESWWPWVLPTATISSTVGFPSTAGSGHSPPSRARRSSAGGGRAGPGSHSPRKGRMVVLGREDRGRLPGMRRYAPRIAPRPPMAGLNRLCLAQRRSNFLDRIFKGAQTHRIGRTRTGAGAPGRP